MKKEALLLVLILFITSCVPDPETLAGVTRKELATGKAVEKLITKNCDNAPVVSNDCLPTLAEAHEREKVDIAEHAWDDLRENGPKVLDGGAIEAGVGDSFKVSVK